MNFALSKYYVYSQVYLLLFYIKISFEFNQNLAYKIYEPTGVGEKYIQYFSEYRIFYTQKFMTFSKNIFN